MNNISFILRQTLTFASITLEQATPPMHGEMTQSGIGTRWSARTVIQTVTSQRTVK